MFTPDRLMLFTKKVKLLRFPVSIKKQYKVLALTENCDFTDVYDNLNFFKQDIKAYCNPKFKVGGKTILSDKTKNKEMKERGMITYPYIKNIDKLNKNSIIDLTQFGKTLRNRTKNNFNSPRANILFSGGLSTFASDKDFYNTLLYIVDLRKPFEVATNRRLAWIPIFHNLRHKENIPYIDSMILCVISENGTPVYIKIFDKHEKINATRALAILKSIKVTNSNEEEFGDNISEQVKISESDKEDIENFTEEETLYKIPDDKVEDALKDSISYLAKNHPDDANSIISTLNEKPTNLDDVIKRNALYLAALKYKFTNDKNEFDKTLSKIRSTLKLATSNEKKKKVKKDIDLEIGKYVERSSGEYKAPNLSTDPLNGGIKIKNVLDNNVPSNIVENKQESFHTHFFNDLVKIMQTFKSNDYPLTLVKYDLKTIRDETDLKNSDLVSFKFTMKDKDGTEFKNEVHIPFVDKNGRMKINGLDKVLIAQLMLKPVYFPSPGICKISTFYSTVQIQYRELRNKAYTIAYITGMVVPIYLVFAMIYKRGLDDVFSKLGYSRDDLIITKTPQETREAKKENPKWFIQFLNNEYIFFPEKVMQTNPMAASFFNSMKMINYTQRKITADQFLSNDSLEDMLIINTGKKNAAYNMRSFFNGFLDPISLEVIETQGYPTKLGDLLWRCTELVHTDKYDRRTDLNVQRYRTTESFLHILYKQMLMSYNVYRNQKLLGFSNPEFVIKPDYVFKEIVNTQLVRSNENINPIEELATATRMTYVGIGGVMNKEGASEKMRIVDETYYGLIDTIDTPEGGSNIGLLQHATVGALLKDTRGSFVTKEMLNESKTGISSVSSVMTPFYNHDDSARLMMAANQIRQAVPLLNKEIPLVQTGYETALSPYLSDTFIKKAEFSGVVKEVNEGVIVIESNEKGSKGKRQNVDLIPKKLTSGMTMHSLSYFTPKVKVGDKVKKYQMLAEGSSIKDGVISLGTNLLIAFTPFDGSNHDDSIIISSELSDSVSSKHIENYTIHILPNSQINHVPGLTNGKVDYQKIQKLMSINEGIEMEKGDILLSFTPHNISEFLELNPDEKVYSGGIIKHKVNKDGRLIDVKIYANDDINNYQGLKHLDNMSKEKHGTTHDGSYKIKGDKFEGIIIEMTYEFIENGLNSADKYCNRHGNKGVVCSVEENMPVTPWGQKIDMIANPLGVIGRMNIGQIMEAYLGLISWKVREDILKNPSQKNTIKLITNVYKNILDKSKDALISKTIIGIIKKMSKSNFQSYIENLKSQKGLPWIYPSYSTPSFDEIMKALKVVGLKDKYTLDLPSIGKGDKAKTPVAIGYIYMYKMEHMSSKKISSRSTGKYVTKLMQPTAGKKAKGGQRVGEFDSWSLFAHGATNLIKEMFGPQSDDFLSKNEIISGIIENGYAHNIDKLKKTPTRDLLEVYFRLMLLDFK